MYPGLNNSVIAAEPGRAAAPVLDVASDPLPAKTLATSILVVEDEMLIAWQVQDLLHDLGFADVRTAGSHAEAVKAAREALPGLLICDVNLGHGPDGIATALAIREDRPMPVVFITGYSGDEIRKRIAEVCPDAPMLRKPIERRRLKASLHELFGRTRH